MLVFDLGGGTFDVSVATIHEQDFKILAVAGDTHLGGEDFDNRLITHCRAHFLKQTEVDLFTPGFERALRRLRKEVEAAKRLLSASVAADIDIEALAEGHDLFITITRAEFEAMCEKDFQRCLVSV